MRLFVLEFFVLMAVAVFGRALPLHPAWRLRCWWAPSGQPHPAPALPHVVPARPALPWHALGGLHGAPDDVLGLAGGHRVEVLAATKRLPSKYLHFCVCMGFDFAALLVKFVSLCSGWCFLFA